MSIELILAIFFFGVLPLIERALRGKREQQTPPREGSPYDEPPYEEGPFEAPQYEVPQYVPPPPEPAPYEVPPAPAQRAAAAEPKAVRQRASEVPISRATAHDRRTADAFDRPRERRRTRGGRVADLLHTEAGLKHAFVVMTVLGPCRAFVPYDPP